jgi:hypothetical protein
LGFFCYVDRVVGVRRRFPLIVGITMYV